MRKREKRNKENEASELQRGPVACNGIRKATVKLQSTQTLQKTRA